MKDGSRQTFSEISQQLDDWAGSSRLERAADIGRHLAEIHRASSEIVRAIEALKPGSEPDHDLRSLVAIEQWTFEELLDHLEALRDPLGDALKPED